MIRIYYKNFNELKEKEDKFLMAHFLAHPMYYSIMDLNMEDLENKEVRDNVLFFAKDLQRYNQRLYFRFLKYEPRNKAKELHFPNSCELFKHSYKYKRPIVFRDVDHFDLFEKDEIKYLKVQYNTKKQNIKYCKELSTIKRSECFILDDEMVYSLTPESIAKTISDNLLCIKDDMSSSIISGTNTSTTTISTNTNIKKSKNRKNLIFLDPFAGAGGNCAQMNEMFSIAADIHFHRLKQCKHNCYFYNKNVDFVLCAYPSILKNFRTGVIDVIFLAIPWGGIDYKDQVKSNWKAQNTLNDTVSFCLEKAAKVTKNVILFLPRITKLSDLMKMYKLYNIVVSQVEKEKRSGKGKREDKVEEEIKEKKKSKYKNKRKKRKDYGIFIESFTNRGRLYVLNDHVMSPKSIYYKFNESLDFYDNSLNERTMKQLCRKTVSHFNAHFPKGLLKPFNPSKKNKRHQQKKETSKKSEGGGEGGELRRLEYEESGTGIPSKEPIKETDPIEGITVNSSSDEENKERSYNETKCFWQWHNVAIHVYFGDICKDIRKRKYVNHDSSVFYVPKDFITHWRRNKKKTNLSLQRYTEHKWTRDIKKEKTEGEKTNKTKNDKFKGIVKAEWKGAVSCIQLHYMVKHKLDHIVTKVLIKFYEKLREVLGLDYMSFMNTVYIDGTIFKDNEKLRNNPVFRNTFYYQTRFNIYKYSSKYTSSLTSFFNAVLRKIKKNLTLLFSLYTHDVSFLSYFCKYYKVEEKVELMDKKKQKEIYFHIINLLMTLITYMYLFFNIMNQKLCMRNIFDRINVIYDLELFYENCMASSTGYRLLDYNGYNSYFFGKFRKLMRRIIYCAIKLNDCIFNVSNYQITKIFFRFFFKASSIAKILNIKKKKKISYTERKYTVVYLFIRAIHRFTLCFINNINVSSQIDYFISLLLFYFNQVHMLSSYRKEYKTVYYYYLNHFLTKNFYITLPRN